MQSRQISLPVRLWEALPEGYRPSRLSVADVARAAQVYDGEADSLDAVRVRATDGGGTVMSIHYRDEPCGPLSRSVYAPPSASRSTWIAWYARCLALVQACRRRTASITPLYERSTALPEIDHDAVDAATAEIGTDVYAEMTPTQVDAWVEWLDTHYPEVTA